MGDSSFRCSSGQQRSSRIYWGSLWCLQGVLETSDVFVWHFVTLQLLRSWWGNQVMTQCMLCNWTWLVPFLLAGLVTEFAGVGNGKVVVWWVVVERSLEPSWGKSADGSIPLPSEFRAADSHILLFCLWNKSDGLFWASSQGVYHKQILQIICCSCLIIYCYKVIEICKELSFFKSWFPVFISADEWLAKRWTIP